MRKVEPDAELRTPFNAILAVLQDEQKDFPRVFLQRFSDLDPASLKALRETWPKLTLTRKNFLMAGLFSLLDSDTLVSFDEIGRAFIDDADPEVRAGALRLLSESDDPKLVPIFIDILKQDADLAPRREAANLLGEFVMLGELEELPPDQHRGVEDALLAVASGSDASVLCRSALEAVGYSARPEVHNLIEAAYRRTESDWVASALTAMGRSSDESWEPHVLDMLLNEEPRIRLAAVEAAGQLSLDSAALVLLRLLEDEDDDLVTAAAIWSLSQIGGEDARIYLQTLLDQAVDPEQIEFLEDALDNLTFTDELNHFDLMEIDPDVEDDEKIDRTDSAF